MKVMKTEREEQVTETQKSPAKKQETQFGVTVVFSRCILAINLICSLRGIL